MFLNAGLLKACAGGVPRGEALSAASIGSRGLSSGVRLYQVDNVESGRNLNRAMLPFLFKKELSGGSVNAILEEEE